MQADVAAFSFLRNQSEYVIPFFQRSYVWDKSNWKELLDNLLNEECSHFLGSIILKRNQTPSGTMGSWNIIDGQQRLTTLSVLFRAAYDTLPIEKYDLETQNAINAEKDFILYNLSARIGNTKSIKIVHSMLDSDAYADVINGEAKKKVDTILLNDECGKTQKPSNNILQCYKYYYKALDGKSTNGVDPDSVLVFEFLKNDENKILVKIDLDSNENEQAIFDTINTAGIRLTCSDTIKNAVFQHLNEYASSENKKKQVVQIYKKDWEAIFANNDNSIDFWTEEKKRGRIKTDNLEILLQSIAMIKKFFNHYDNSVSELPLLYKEYIQNLDETETKAFIKEIAEYATIYREYFSRGDINSYHSCLDPLDRLLHILGVLDISTMHPYILKLLKEYDVMSCQDYPTEFVQKIVKIEKYIMRLIACNESVSNLNKVCTLLLNGKTIDAEINDAKKEKISDDKVKAGFRIKKENKVATILLYWMELYIRNNDNLATKSLAYSYTLEHIMPQKWEENWSVTDLPVKDCVTNAIIQNNSEAMERRENAVFELGNMLLLNGKLNTSLRNYNISRKVDGENSKKGIRYYNELGMTKEFISTYDNNQTWNEYLIRQRTDELAKKFIEIWTV